MGNEYLPNKEFERIIKDFHNSKIEKNKISIILEDFKRRQDNKSIRNVCNKEYEEIQKEYIELFKNISNKHTFHKEELSQAFYQLSLNLVRFAKFSLIDEDDAIQEGVMICFEKVEKFDPNKGKAFNYMTTCIYNHFRQLYRTAKNYNELKKKYHLFLEQKYSEFIPRNNKIEKKPIKKNDKDGW